MLKDIEKKILIFTNAYGVEKAEIVHGTLFVKFNNPSDKEDFRKSLKSMMKMFIEQDTGVNGNVVGDEIAYDFVPEKDEKGWNTTETQESIISTQLELQEGK